MLHEHGMSWIDVLPHLQCAPQSWLVGKSGKTLEIRKAGGKNPTQEDVLNETIYKCWKICSYNLFIYLFLLGFGAPEMEGFGKKRNRIPDLGLELPSCSQVSVRGLRNATLTSVRLLQNPTFPQNKRKQGRKWTSGRCFGIAASPGTPHGMVPPPEIIQPQGGVHGGRRKWKNNFYPFNFPNSFSQFNLLLCWEEGKIKCCSCERLESIGRPDLDFLGKNAQLLLRFKHFNGDETKVNLKQRSHQGDEEPNSTC